MKRTLNSSPGLAWRKIVLGLVFIFLGDVSFRVIGKAFLFSPWAASGSIGVAKELYWVADRRPDVVFLGDSRTGNGLKPTAVEKELLARGGSATVVNVWLAGAGFAEAKTIIEHVIAPAPPKLIVYSLNENRLSAQNPGRPQAGWYQNRLFDVSGYELLYEKWDWRINRFFGTQVWGAFIKRAVYNYLIDMVKTVFKKARSQSPGLGQMHGYLPRFGKQRDVRLEFMRAADDEKYRTFQITDWGRDQFVDLLETLRAHDLKVVIVILPVAPELARKFPPHLYADYISRVKAITTSFGFPLVDFYQGSGLLPDAFFDLQHLNDSGAEKLSTMLSQTVILPALVNWGKYRASFIEEKQVK
jgi:hypothetical protein